VVERTEKEHDIRGSVAVIQRPSVPESAAGNAIGAVLVKRSSVIDEPLHWIDQVNLVPEPCEPRRILARTASDVQDDSRRTRDPPPDDLLRPDIFELRNAFLEALVFGCLFVIGQDLRR
jgi:hypothetical protein